MSPYEHYMCKSPDGGIELWRYDDAERMWYYTDSEALSETTVYTASVAGPEESGRIILDEV
jgi:hypothetical protein